MSVGENVAFGLRMQKVNADDSHKRVQEVLQLALTQEKVKDAKEFSFEKVKS